MAIATLVVITLLNIFGVRVVAIVNNTGVAFELLGLVVFAVILALFNNNQGVDVVFDTGGADFSAATFLVAMFMGLFVIYGFDTASTLAEETNDPRRVAPRAVLGSVAAAFIVGFIFLWAMLMAVPGDLDEVVAAGGISPPEIIQANLSDALADGLPARRRVRDLRLLPGDPGLDDPARLLDGARQAAARLEARSAACTRGRARRSAPACSSRGWPRSSSSSTPAWRCSRSGRAG